MDAAAQRPGLGLPSMRTRVDSLTRSDPVDIPGGRRWLEFRFGLSIVSTFCLSTAVALIGWVVIPTVFLSWNASAVESASMEPAIERGDVVVFRPTGSTSLSPDMVIRFRADEAGGSTVHRIIEYDARTSSFITQGDANPTADTDQVVFEQIDGVGVLLIPLIGHPVLWLNEGEYVRLLLLTVGFVLILVSSRTAPEPFGSDKLQRLEGPLTFSHSAATSRQSMPLFPVDLATRLTRHGSSA